MGLKLITPSAVDALSLVEAKAHLRVSHTDDDTLIAALTKAACTYAEAFLGRALIDQTWDLYLDTFPTGADTEIKIPLPPLIEVTSVTYDQPSGLAAVIDPGDYYVDSVSQPGWVVTSGGFTWPTPLDAINAVRIRFRAGYVDNNSPPGNAVPEDIKSAIKLTLASLYEQRESQVVEARLTPQLLPWGAEQLLRQHRIELSMA